MKLEFGNGVSRLPNHKTEYQNEYIKRAYDRVNLLIPKGEKTKVKAVADFLGMSVNAFIWAAVGEKMARVQQNPQHIEDIAEALHCDFFSGYYDNCYEIIPDSNLFVMAQEPEEMGNAVIYVHYPDGNIDFLICRDTIEDIKKELADLERGMQNGEK